MGKPDTKQKIISEALKLFSQKGYDGVTVADIAAAVGIKAASLYKHYKGKGDIFSAVFEEMKMRYAKQAESMQMHGSDAAQDEAIFSGISEAELIGRGKLLFNYFLHDEYASRFRKMLTIEQYKNPESATLYAGQYIDEPLSYQGMLFELLTKSGGLLPENAQIMALQFYAPVFLMLLLCDCQPEREAEAISMVEEHIKQFCRTYKNDEMKNRR